MYIFQIFLTTEIRKNEIFSFLELVQTYQATILVKKVWWPNRLRKYYEVVIDGRVPLIINYFLHNDVNLAMAKKTTEQLLLLLKNPLKIHPVC